jgi:proprotein convertase subtilisin/kexin type 5
MTTDNTCETKCPSSYYKDDTLCKKCPDACIECESATKCTKCKCSYLFLSTTNKCVVSCPVGMYSK